MSDNPFEEDSERTVIRPIPGGRRPAAPAPAAPRDVPRDASIFDQQDASGPAQPPPRAPPPSAMPLDGAETVSLGLNPLVSAAGPLLSVLGRLGRTLNQPNPADLRDRTIRQLQTFERDAQTAGLPRDLVVRARYALCASLDDIAQSTPWGRDGAWASRPLVTSFREQPPGSAGIASGNQFFTLLDEAKRNPGNDLTLLELLYLCLSLGFHGKYRVSQRPAADLDRERQDLYNVITAQHPQTETALSPHWQGVAAPYKPARAVVPLWVLGAGVLAIIGGLFVWFSTVLNNASDETFARLLAAPQAVMPKIARIAPVRPPPPPPVVEAESLSIFLKPEIDQGLVSVLGTRAVPIVRIRNRGLFPSGSAVVSSNFVRLLERIGEALKTERGPVQVIGYTDNQPIRTVQFPSNFQLSAGRAEAARAIIVRALGDPGRVTAEGRADADPVSSNATPEGREDNRRIEVVLRRQFQQ